MEKMSSLWATSLPSGSCYRPTDPMAVRLFVLQAQYRKPIDFTDEAMAAAKMAGTRLRKR